MEKGEESALAASPFLHDPCESILNDGALPKARPVHPLFEEALSPRVYDYDFAYVRSSLKFSLDSLG